MADLDRPEHRPGNVDVHDLHKDVPPRPPGDPDRDLNTRMLWRLGIGLSAGTIVAAALMLGAFFLEKRHLEREDPARSPVAEASGPQSPPGPLLQPHPNNDIKLFLAAEDRLLSTYGWTDQSAGIARVPLARAMAIVAARGVAPLASGPAAETAPPADVPSQQGEPVNLVPLQETRK